MFASNPRTDRLAALNDQKLNFQATLLDGQSIGPNAKETLNGYSIWCAKPHARKDRHQERELLPFA
jgi:hypothetical protein